MVEERLSLEPEVQEILNCIDNNQNFLLSGGAGSGKTYSLVHVIRQVLSENLASKVACMTYTNAAVREIEERVNHKNLNVSTIHDFLWDNIKHFQKELKSAIIALANDENVSRMTIEDAPVPDDYFENLEDKIQYKEYLRLKEGIISHDELLIIANYIFENYPKLSDIVKDKYHYIFIDEYQDTNSAVVEIFLNHFKKSAKRNIIGFFGDAMQSIYDDGVGNLNEYLGEGEDFVFEVKKLQNRRNPQKIITLANRLRTDGIIQEPSADENAPNMDNENIKEGDIKFIYSSNLSISQVKEYLTGTYAWDFTNAKETKELNLTHNLIAEKAGFRRLMDIYDKDLVLKFRDRIKKYIKENGITEDFSYYTFGEVVEYLQNGKTGRALNAVSPTAGMRAFIEENPDLYAEANGTDYSILSRMYVNKDQLLEDKKQNEEEENIKGSKRDSLIKHLFKIQDNISFYQNAQYNEFLRVTDYRKRINTVQDKRTLKENIENLIHVGNKTIEEVIIDANEKGICLIDDKLNEFQERKEYVYNRMKTVEFGEFQKLYEYLEGKTPFSTQHKTKGTEFKNIFVILDNGGWRNYNFTNLFLGGGSESVLERTQKLFYVCCTRSKENLAVFFHNPNPQVIEKAVEWFGEANVINLE